MSFKDIGCRDVCLFLNFMDHVDVEAPKNTFKEVKIIHSPCTNYFYILVESRLPVSVGFMFKSILLTLPSLVN